jgi:heptaprenyl diphosphate synthase
VLYVVAVATNPLSSLPNAAVDSSRIETCLLETVRIEGDEYLTEIASHLIKAGGKRQRPHFTVASAATGLPDGELVHDDVVRGGVAVELVQVGSLYHDDVMDEAEIRRQVISVNARWGNLRAILAGDFLLAKASEIAASLGTEVAGLLARTIGDLCRGQVAELQTLYDVNRTEAQYFPSIAGKTASLFSAATRIGGIVTGCDRSTIELLTTFGEMYGMAFQVIDDILDVIATDEQLGKPAGKDMVEGVYSLPVIHTLASSNGPRLREILLDGGPEGGLSQSDRLAAIELVREGPGIESARQVAAGFVQRAQSTIARVSDNQASRALGDTAQHLLHSVAAAQAA